MLEGKVAVVTGAGHGIGRGHALELARRGARVVVNDLGSSVTGEGSSKDADLTVELIRTRGGVAIADYGNVTNEVDAEAMIERAIDEWGRFDILVNNAGIVRDVADQPRRISSLAVTRKSRARQPGPDSQHDFWGRAGRQFRPDELRDGQGGRRGTHAHAGTGIAPSRGNGECHRTRGSDTYHRHHAQCPCSRRAG
jgi:NAD(P)-dependent dehydrogenase (short-subunit alcohol dehydrogenase family)